MFANLLIPGIGTLLIAGFLLRKRAAAARRTWEMRALAGRMGWSFHAHLSLETVPDRERFSLFTTGTDQRILNHLSGTVAGHQVAVFDLEYASAGRNGGRTSVRTVVWVHAPRLDLPAFSVRPEAVVHRSGDGLGRDIDLAVDPEFSRAYLLRGRSKSDVRAVFDGPVRALFNAHPGTCADAAGHDLLLWRRAELMAAKDVPARAQAALDIAARMREAVHYAGV